MTRREVIKSLVMQIVEAADFGMVGQKDFFGEPITDQSIENAVRSACDTVHQFIDADPIEQARRRADAERSGPVLQGYHG